MKRHLASAVLAAVASLPSASPLAPGTFPPGLSSPLEISPLQAADASVPASAEPPPPARPPPLGVLVNLHTGETLALSDDAPSKEEFSILLEDRGLGRRVEMAPRLLVMLRALARENPGARFEIVSGFRSPKRNEMMRKKGRRVASHSQHTLGAAIDFRIAGLSTGKLAQALEKLKWKGGIGQYTAKHDRFVHVDVGPSRRWWGR